MSEDGIKERFNFIDKTIEMHEKRISNLEKTYQVMEKMEYRMEQMEKTMAAMDEKLDEQASEKGKKWDKLIDYVFYFIIGTLLTYLCVKLGVK